MPLINFIRFIHVQGQFNFAEVVIKPLDYNSNLVSVRVKEELRNVVTNTGPHVISDDNLPILVRQLAVHANVSLFTSLAEGSILLGFFTYITGSFLAECRKLPVEWYKQ